jgi:hypothetical protein
MMISMQQRMKKQAWIFATLHWKDLFNPILLWNCCNLKIVSDVFCGWRLQTLIRLNCWRRGDSMVPKNSLLMYFCFLCVMLLCRLWRGELGELVSVMERNPCCSMKTLLELCVLSFYKEIGRRIFAQRRDEVTRSIFDAGWGRKVGSFGDEEKLSG